MILYIKQPNHKIFFRNKVCRTPIKLNINKQDIPYYKQQLLNEGISLYEIYDEEVMVVKDINIVNNNISKDINGKDIEKQNNTNKTQNISLVPGRVVKSKVVSDKEDNLHDTFEEADESLYDDVKIDFDSDDILKQLLNNI